MRMKCRQGVLRSGIVLMLMFGLSVTASALNIQKIAVRGNTFISEASILAGIDSKVGLPLNPKVIASDVQKIYDIGFFSAVDVETETLADGVNVTFVVAELPLITNIVFDGNQRLKNEKLEEVLKLSPTSLTDVVNQKFYPTKIKNDIALMTDLYHREGYPDVKITTELKPDAAAPQEKVTLIYHITENKRVTVRGITFEGNTAFTEEELRKAMTVKVKGLFSFITGSGKYEKTTFEADLEKITYFYADHGYIDTKIKDYTLDLREGTNDLYITVVLEEGPIYTIEKVEITGNTVYSTAELQKEVKTVPGEPFSRSKIRNDMFAIADLYAQKGYIRPISDNTVGKLNIDPDIRLLRDTKQVSVMYTISEGVPHTINRITFSGNKVTRDKVMRRELSVQEGEILNGTALRQSQQRVYNLGIFDELNANVTEAKEPNAVDINMEVKERSQIGTFNIGGGWDTVSKWALTGGFTSDNLFGLAHALDFSATIGTTSTIYNIDYNMPRVFDTKYTVGMNVYDQEKDYDAYDSRSLGGGLRFGRKITENIFASLKYRYERVRISDVSEDASVRIRESEGVSKTSAVSLTLKRSTINNVLLPTKGWLTELKGEVAGGILGAENDFYKIVLTNNTYFPIYKNIAFRLKEEYAYTDAYGDSDEVPILDRLYAGGANTLRGFEERSVGPKDENDEAIGGNTRLLFSSEIIFPVQKSIRLITFFDAGNVYGLDDDIDFSDLRKSVGVGFRLSTPFGLFRLDWGYKLDREEGESKDEFHFSIGNTF